MKKQNKMEINRINARSAARIAYRIGTVAASGSKYPVSAVINTVVNISKDEVCRIARMVGMRVTKHCGMWYEHNRLIDDIIAMEFEKKNRS